MVTECSGLQALPYALDKLGLQGQYVIEAACEIDPKCRRVVKVCHTGKAAPRLLYRGVGARLPAELPDHDLYVAGIASPCLPFHVQGCADTWRGYGMAIDDIVATLEVKLPRAFILESVKGAGHTPPADPGPHPEEAAGHHQPGLSRGLQGPERRRLWIAAATARAPTS